MMERKYNFCEVKWMPDFLYRYTLPNWSQALTKSLRTYGILLLFGGVIVGLDQWTKYLVRTELAYGQVWAPWDWLLPYARIIHTQNTGAAFGMFQGMNMIFAALAVIVAGVLCLAYSEPKEVEV